MGLADCINSVLPGFTRNPYNTAYACGGSSGGTAVALAANFGMVGLGTDTGGSVRAPASITNLVGIRPTVGLVSRTGMGPLDSERDTPGPMARTVEDVARLLDVIVGEDPLDARISASTGHIPATYVTHLRSDGLRGARIGVFRQTLHLHEGADPGVVDLFDRAVASLSAAGACVVDDFNVPGFEELPRPPQTAAHAKADWEALFAYEGPTFPFRTVADLRHAACVHPLHAARIAEVAAVTNTPHDDPETMQGRRDEQRYRDVLSAAFEAFDVEALAFSRVDAPTGPERRSRPKPARCADVRRLGHAMAGGGGANRLRRRRPAYRYAIPGLAVDGRATHRTGVCVRAGNAPPTAAALGLSAG